MTFPKETLEKILDLGATGAPMVHLDGANLALLPDGYRFEDLNAHAERWKANPTFRKEHIEFGDLASFQDYYKEAKTDASTIFASMDGLSFQGIVDYHTPETPSFCRHTLSYRASLSKEWLRWCQIDGEMMPQKAFAEFIEENIPDIVDPDGGTIMDVAQNLYAKKGGGFKSVKRLDDGSTALEYIDEVSDAKTKNDVAVPNQLTLGIPVFENGVRYSVKAFLRFRIDTHGEIGKPGLYFKIDLHRADFIADKAFEEMVSSVAESAGHRVYLGQTNGNGR